MYRVCQISPEHAVYRVTWLVRFFFRRISRKYKNNYSKEKAKYFTEYIEIYVG